MPPRNQTVPEGKTAVLICKATGFPKPAITWTFNDRSVPSLAIEKHTEEGYQLLLQNVTKYMEGIYKCTAKNKASKASSTASLGILGKYIKTNKATIKNMGILIYNNNPISYGREFHRSGAATEKARLP